jgi:hypothetical protein
VREGEGSLCWPFVEEKGPEIVGHEGRRRQSMTSGTETLSDASVTCLVFQVLDKVGFDGVP